MEIDRKNTTTPIFFYILKNNMISIFLILIFMILPITTIVYNVVDNNIKKVLDRTLVVAWEEYNKFFQETKDSFSFLSNNFIYSDDSTLEKIVTKIDNCDFWFIYDDKKIINSNGNSTVPFAQGLLPVYELCKEKKQIISSSELSSIGNVSDFHPNFKKRFLLPNSLQSQDRVLPVILQVTAIPIFNSSHEIKNIVIIGKVLNNDNSIVNNIDKLIPGTNSTISARNGLRISGNIKSRSYATYIGVLQEPDHINTVYNGHRYYGHAILEDLNDNIISEPIYNSKGDIIGALTTGFPYFTFAQLKMTLTLYILIVAILSCAVAIISNYITSKKTSKPISHLSTLTKEISLSEEINEQHIGRLKKFTPSEVTEIQALQYSFTKMTTSLYEKNEESKAYLKELYNDKEKLQVLTDQLHRANQELEQKVKIRTEDLHNAVTELIELNRIKSKFLSNMSHEIRTPLNSIIGFSDVLDDESFGTLNEKQKEYIKIILSSAEHLLQLINDILDMSIIEQGKLTINKQWCDANKLIHSIITVLQSQADHNKLDISVDLSPDLPSVLLDPVRIKQVLYNIIHNAIKFTSPGGSIKVSSNYNIDNIVITITDNGIGIAEDIQEKIFNEFFQAEHIHKKIYDGVGLGLPLSRKLIEMHNGKIELISQLNLGTKIIIYLPLKIEVEPLLNC